MLPKHVPAIVSQHTMSEFFDTTMIKCVPGMKWSPEMRGLVLTVCVLTGVGFSADQFCISVYARMAISRNFSSAMVDGSVALGHGSGLRWTSVTLFRALTQNAFEEERD
jgi:Na+/glutamate symporter